MSDEYYDSKTAPAAPDLKRSRRQHRNGTLDRLPPHSPEAEQGVLGCIMIDENSIILCIERFKKSGEEFYDLRHQTIYETMIELYDDRVPIDLINLQERLKLWEKLEQVGGISFLSALADAVSSAANLPSYVDIVLERFNMRKMIRVCTEAVARLYEHQGPVETILEQVEHDVLQVSESRVEVATHDMHTLVTQAIQTIEDLHINQGIITGVATGFADLDKITNGLQKGEMIVIAGRPSTGKTSLAMNIVEHVACVNHLPTGVMSLEMTARGLVFRMLCSRARVNLRNVNAGFLADHDFPKLTGAAGILNTAPIFIDDSAGLSVLQIRAKLRRMKQKHDIKLAVVDYLQLANAPGCQNREQEVATISKGLKNLAKELDIPILVLCQMNRDIEREKNRKPRMADLRESGAIEQDADIIGMLYRVKAEYEDESEDSCWSINCGIVKNRNGPTADIRLTFLRGHTRFESAAKVSDDDVPHDQQSNLPHND